MAEKKKTLEDRLFEKILNRMEKLGLDLADLAEDSNCHAMIPTYVIEDMEHFIGEKVYFLGIS